MKSLKKYRVVKLVLITVVHLSSIHPVLSILC
jgi:hypothetical protein